jgi:hypothetical protein
MTTRVVWLSAAVILYLAVGVILERLMYWRKGPWDYRDPPPTWVRLYIIALWWVVLLLLRTDYQGDSQPED